VGQTEPALLDLRSQQRLRPFGIWGDVWPGAVPLLDLYRLLAPSGAPRDFAPFPPGAAASGVPP
jgi:hypothetical protein